MDSLIDLNTTQEKLLARVNPFPRLELTGVIKSEWLLQLKVCLRKGLIKLKEGMILKSVPVIKEK